MKTLVLANQKGGVGKSAIATQLAHYFYRQGLSVLVIDLDHQQNTSAPLRLNPAVTVAPFAASRVFYGNWAKAALDNRFLLVAGDDGLSLLERQPSHHNLFAGNLRDFLEVSSFDISILDTNPNPDIRYAAALVCADFVLAPIQLNQEAVSGIASLLNHPKYGIARIKATLNNDLEFLGILPNLVEPTPFQRANLRLLVSRFGARLLSGEVAGQRFYAHIPKRTAMAEAQAAGVFLPELAKTSAREAWREIKPVFDLILKGIAPKAATGGLL